MERLTKVIERSSRPWADWSDEELVLAYRRCGDRKVFEVLVRRYERELYNYLRQFLGDAQFAEDMFQETFLSVHLRIHQFHEDKRFRPWLFAIATNKAIDFQRRNRRHRLASLDMPDGVNARNTDTIGSTIQDDGASPLDESMTRESGARVRNALAELPENTQKLLHLAFHQGMKYQEIGKILGIPLGTVKSRVHTAMRKLFSIWERKYPEDEMLKRISDEN